MASCSFTALGLFLLVLCNGCLAIRQGRQEEQEPSRQSQYDCRLQKLRTLEPDSQIQHEAGITQIWNPNSDEMQCAGITASRHVIERRAALLPSFTNAPMVVYVEQGSSKMMSFIRIITCMIMWLTSYIYIVIREGSTWDGVSGVSRDVPIVPTPISGRKQVAEVRRPAPKVAPPPAGRRLRLDGRSGSLGVQRRQQQACSFRDSRRQQPRKPAWWQPQGMKYVYIQS